MRERNNFEEIKKKELKKIREKYFAKMKKKK